MPFSSIRNSVTAAEPLRTANEYNLCQTCHERMTTYTNVHPNFQKRRAHVSSIRNSVTGALPWHMLVEFIQSQ